MAHAEATFLTEMRGISSDAYTLPAFDEAGVQALTESRYHHDGSDIRHIFVGVDPAAGGAGSDYAMVSSFYTSVDEMIICGAETASYHGDNTKAVALLIHHVMALRRNIPGASDARIIIIPESNLATEHMWAMREVHNSGLGDICVMREDHNRVGVRTNKELKHAMAMALNQKIIRRNIHILDDFVCVGDGNSTEDMTDKLVEQLSSYSRIVKPPRDKHHGNPIVSYSGKQGYGHDDLAISVQLQNVMVLPFWSKREVYGEYW